jgi:hypothetical protein
MKIFTAGKKNPVPWVKAVSISPRAACVVHGLEWARNKNINPERIFC